MYSSSNAGLRSASESNPNCFYICSIATVSPRGDQVLQDLLPQVLQDQVLQDLDLLVSPRGDQVLQDLLPMRILFDIVLVSVYESFDGAEIFGSTVYLESDMSICGTSVFKSLRQVVVGKNCGVLKHVNIIQIYARTHPTLHLQI